MLSHPIKGLMIAGGMMLLSIGVAAAEAPSPEAMSAARTLVTTLKLSDQYKGLLPGILLSIKPAVTQDRAELEHDYDTIAPPAAAEAYKPYYEAMVDSMATAIASNFTAQEIRDIEAFCKGTAGRKFLDKWPGLLQQSAQVAEEGGRKAADGLKASLPQLLRQKKN
jgi:hypothetical protein